MMLELADVAELKDWHGECCGKSAAIAAMVQMLRLLKWLKDRDF